MNPNSVATTTSELPSLVTLQAPRPAMQYVRSLVQGLLAVQVPLEGDADADASDEGAVTTCTGAAVVVGGSRLE